MCVRKFPYDDFVGNLLVLFWRKNTHKLCKEFFEEEGFGELKRANMHRMEIAVDLMIGVNKILYKFVDRFCSFQMTRMWQTISSNCQNWEFFYWISMVIAGRQSWHFKMELLKKHQQVFRPGKICRKKNVYGELTNPIGVIMRLEQLTLCLFKIFRLILFILI